MKRSEPTPIRVPSAWPAGWRGAQVVFFDCDSTLSRIEGIDELGKRAGSDLAELTDRAMRGEIPFQEVYRQRLDRIQPSPEDFAWLAECYRETEVSMAGRVVSALERLGVRCYVISGGLWPGVAPFAAQLGIPAERVHAVPYPLSPEDAGSAAGHAEARERAAEHPLARNGGKPEVVAQILAELETELDPGESLLIGDGTSDLEAADTVGLFVGFGGVVTREKVEQQAPVWIREPSLAAVSVLAAGPERWVELERLDTDLYHAALHALADSNRVRIRDPR